MISARFAEYESTWKKEITGSSYLGELALPKQLLDQLCGELGTDALNHPVALTVLAVNCAYYYLDQDGFWPHFCHNLGLSYSPGNTDKLGHRIERFLNSVYKHRKKRSGTYRYVGAILEQCGVSRKHLPRFVDFLKKLEGQFGWDGILGLDLTRYLTHVPESGSKYLLDYLNDEAGWKFVRDVARNLSQRDRGLVETSELEALKGYHPSFWGEITSNLQLPPPKIRRSKIPLPVLIVDVSTRSLYIRLDCDNAFRSSYRLDGQILTSHTYQIRSTRESDFRESYNFEVLVDGAWIPLSVPGWMPKNGNFAFFHESRGYVCSINKLKPGIYWLIAPRSFHVPEEIILSSQGTISLFCGYFEIYEVVLKQDTDLTTFGVTGALPRTPYLSYSETCERLNASADTRLVFVGRLPMIKVNNLDPEVNSAYIIVAEVDGRQRRVSTKEIQNSTINLEGLGFKFPGKGSLWIEVTDRTVNHAGEQVVDRLDFVAIMQCRIQGPKHLLSSEEEVELTLSGPESYSLELDEGTQLEPSGKRWMVGPNLRVVEGNLKAGNFSVRIAYRLFRAGMLLEDGADTIFKNDLDSDIAVRAEGFPRTEALLYLESPEGLQKIWSGQFNQAGRSELTTFSFRDAILANEPIAGTFEIGRPGGTVKTSLFYLHTAKACESISLADAKKYNVDWFGFVSPKFRPLLHFLHNLALRNDVEGDIAFDGVPSELRELTNSFIACSRVFDCRVLAFPGQQLPSNSTSDALAWYREASAIIDGDGDSDKARNLVQAYPGTSGIPLCRWKDLLEQKLSKLKGLALPMHELVGEWAYEVKGTTKICYSGQIASLSFGKDLVDCWRLYFKHDKAAQAYLGAAKLAEKAGGVVGDLARLLAMLTLTKLNQPGAAGYFSRDCHSFFLRLYEAIVGIETEIDEGMVTVLPIRPEDVGLFFSRVA